MTSQENSSTETRHAPVFAATGVCAGYGGQSILDDVSVTIRPGDVYGLIGPNGAGKSTFVKVACGRLKASRGAVTIFDADIATPSAKQRLGVAPQTPALYDQLTVEENIVAFAQYAGLTLGQARQAAARVIERTGLTDHANHCAARLSGGLKQRTNIAAAIAHGPAIIILDEPCANIDPEGVTAVNGLIQSLADEGLSILVITHDMAQAEHICTRIGVLNHGRLVAEDTPARLITNYGGDRYVMTVTTVASSSSHPSPDEKLIGNGFEPVTSGQWRKNLSDHDDIGVEIKKLHSAINRDEEADMIADVQIARAGLCAVLSSLENETT